MWQLTILSWVQKRKEETPQLKQDFVWLKTKREKILTILP